MKGLMINMAKKSLEEQIADAKSRLEKLEIKQIKDDNKQLTAENKQLKADKEKVQKNLDGLLGDLRSYISNMRKHTGNVTHTKEDGSQYSRKALYYEEMPDLLTMFNKYNK